jgi:hypothetical protein
LPPSAWAPGPTPGWRRGWTRRRSSTVPPALQRRYRVLTGLYGTVGLASRHGRSAGSGCLSLLHDACSSARLPGRDHRQPAAPTQHNCTPANCRPHLHHVWEQDRRAVNELGGLVHLLTQAGR